VPSHSETQEASLGNFLNSTAHINAILQNEAAMHRKIAEHAVTFYDITSYLREL
jgi:hypothetical protein